MNMGSSLLLLASLTMLGGTPTDGSDELIDTMMPSITKTPTPHDKVPASLQLLAGDQSLGNQTRPIKANGKPLILTPYIEKGHIGFAKEAAKIKLPELADIATGYSAFITVNKQYGSNLFFWYVLAKEKPSSTAPLILWLQGGPGASSIFGLFVEHGPYWVNENIGLFRRRITWADDYNMLYVDQPAGTGFSFTMKEGGYATNEDEVANDMCEFLRQFFLLFPDLLRNEFYIAGQSYAGKYVPAIANKIHEMKEIPLTGLIIGNGMSDPIHVMDHGDFLFQVGLVDRKGRDEFASMAEKGKMDIKDENWSAAADALDDMMSTYVEKTGTSFFYNYLFDKKPKMFDFFTEYFKSAKVREAIHVGNQPYTILNMVVHGHLKDDIAKSVVTKVQTLLNAGYKVLIYSGHYDVLITYRGTEQYLLALDWKGSSDYKKAKRTIWRVDGEVAGYAREVLNLRQVMVRNAGHMVPFDQPEWTLDMITRFIKGTPFGARPVSLKEPGRVLLEQPMNGRQQAW